LNGAGEDSKAAFLGARSHVQAIQEASNPINFLSTISELQLLD